MTVLRVKDTVFDVYKTFYKIIVRMRKTVISFTHSQPNPTLPPNRLSGNRGENARYRYWFNRFFFLLTRRQCFSREIRKFLVISLDKNT